MPHAVQGKMRSGRRGVAELEGAARNTMPVVRRVIENVFARLVQHLDKDRLSVSAWMALLSKDREFRKRDIVNFGLRFIFDANVVPDRAVQIENVEELAMQSPIPLAKVINKPNHHSDGQFQLECDGTLPIAVRLGKVQPKVVVCPCVTFSF